MSATPPAALPQDPATAAALDLLLHRYSTGPKYLRDPGPTDADVRVLAHAALRAPDHEKRVPFRFVVVRGEAKARLADLFEAYGRRRGKPADELPASRPTDVAAASRPTSFPPNATAPSGRRS